MTIPTTAEIRKFIQQAFSDQELMTFCFDYYRTVYNDFGAGMSKGQKVIAIVDFVVRRDGVETLLINLHQERSDQVTTQLNYHPPSTIHHPPLTHAPRNPRQLFISHANQDAEFAQKLADDLEAEGWQIWIAPDSILPGERWVEAIERGLDESGVFVLVMTPEAVGSKWVNFEAGSAIEDAVQGTMGFVPLMVKACRPRRSWRRYQHVSFTRGRYAVGLSQLLRRLGGSTAVDAADVGAVREPPLPQQPTRSESLDPVDKTPTPKPRIEVVQPAVAKPLIPDHLLPAGDPSRYEILSENRILWLKDGKEMVLIPAGAFLDGEDKQEVELSAFWMDQTPVTNEEYKRFLEVNPSYEVPFCTEDWAKNYSWNDQLRIYPQGKEKHPVVLVSWHDAQEYAVWVRKQLPTEEQWERQHGVWMVAFILGETSG